MGNNELATEFHEAGHTVMLRYHNRPISSVAVSPDMTFAHVIMRDSLNQVIEELRRSVSFRIHRKAGNIIQCFLAGPLSEYFKTKALPGSLNDLATVLELLKLMRTAELRPTLDAYAKATHSLLRLPHMWGAVCALALELHFRRSISGKEATHIIDSCKEQYVSRASELVLPDDPADLLLSAFCEQAERWKEMHQHG